MSILKPMFRPQSTCHGVIHKIYLLAQLLALCGQSLLHRHLSIRYTCALDWVLVCSWEVPCTKWSWRPSNISLFCPQISWIWMKAIQEGIYIYSTSLRWIQKCSVVLIIHVKIFMCLISAVGLSNKTILPMKLLQLQYKVILSNKIVTWYKWPHY